MSVRKKILIVDDDTRLLKLSKDYFTNLGYLLDTAKSAIEGAELVKDTKYDIVITDIKVPVEYSKIEIVQKSESSDFTSPNYIKTHLSELSEDADGDTIEIVGKVIRLFQQTPYYWGCSICKKKVEQKEDGEGWICREHNEVEPTIRLRLSGLVDDGTGTIKATFFGMSGEILSGFKNSDIAQMIEPREERPVNMSNRKARNRLESGFGVLCLMILVTMLRSVPVVAQQVHQAPGSPTEVAATVDSQNLDPSLKSALLDEDWALVLILLEDVEPTSLSPVKRMIMGHACLASNRNDEAFCLFTSLLSAKRK